MTARMPVLAAFLVLLAGWVQAEPWVVPVSQRMASAHKPQGLRAGAFVLHPQTTASVMLNDNIYATSTNRKADTIVKLRPQVAAQSDWSRHALNLLAMVERASYARHEDENTTDYRVAADGRVDIVRNTSLGGGVALARNHEDRGDPESAGSSLEPTRYTTAQAKVGFYRGAGKVKLRADSDVRNLDYTMGTTAAGTPVATHLRDRTEWTQQARVTYQAVPGREVFVRGKADTRAYNIKGSAADALRSSHGREVVGGVVMDVTGKAKLEASAGYVARDYVSPLRKDIQAPAMGAKLVWNPSQITTVTGKVDRTVEETILPGSTAYLHDTYLLGLEHALSQNLLLQGKADYSTNQYQGMAPWQEHQQIWTLDLGTKYYLKDRVAAQAGYQFRQRDSNVSGHDYTRNLLTLGLTGTY